ncbi:hypothetical protein C8R44DRAFT_783844 [Mycena epipterygia]|nr:hypothetical protein C8R44DRAFT_783844 [Mycena epipterygia]
MVCDLRSAGGGGLPALMRQHHEADGPRHRAAGDEYLARTPIALYRTKPPSPCVSPIHASSHHHAPSPYRAKKTGTPTTDVGLAASLPSNAYAPTPPSPCVADAALSATHVPPSRVLVPSSPMMTTSHLRADPPTHQGVPQRPPRMPSQARCSVMRYRAIEPADPPTSATPIPRREKKVHSCSKWCHSEARVSDSSEGSSASSETLEIRRYEVPLCSRRTNQSRRDGSRIVYTGWSWIVQGVADVAQG